MGIDEFKTALLEDPKSNSFSTTIQVIEDHYVFTPTGFKNGELKNEPGENNGSCKIFYFASIQNLNKDLTLACFGNYYFVDVLEDPNGTGHQNIRNFMKTGWDGIEFEGAALQPKDN